MECLRIDTEEWKKKGYNVLVCPDCLRPIAVFKDNQRGYRVWKEMRAVHEKASEKLLNIDKSVEGLKEDIKKMPLDKRDTDLLLKRIESRFR